jgi:hypothetical protein
VAAIISSGNESNPKGAFYAILRPATPAENQGDDPVSLVLLLQEPLFPTSEELCSGGEKALGTCFSGGKEIRHFGMQAGLFTLEGISQMPQQNDATTKVEHAEKILCISLVAHDQSPEVLQPGKQSLNLPASPIAAHATQILRCVSSITTVRSDEFDSVSAKFCVQFV